MINLADKRALISYKKAISPVITAVGSWQDNDTPRAVELIPSIPAAPRDIKGLSTDQIGANNA